MINILTPCYLSYVSWGDTKENILLERVQNQNFCPPRNSNICLLVFTPNYSSGQKVEISIFVVQKFQEIFDSKTTFSIEKTFQ